MRFPSDPRLEVSPLLGAVGAFLVTGGSGGAAAVAALLAGVGMLATLGVDLRSDERKSYPSDRLVSSVLTGLRTPDPEEPNEVAVVPAADLAHPGGTRR